MSVGRLRTLLQSKTLRRLVDLAPLVLRFTCLALGQILLARIMVPSLFGAFALATNWAGFGAIVAVSGLQFTIVKFLPRHAPAAQRLLYTYVMGKVLRRALGLAAMIGLAAVALPTAWMPIDRNAALAAGMLVIPTALAMVRAPASMALGQVWTAQLPESILRPLLVPLALFALAWGGKGLGLAGSVMVAFAIYLGSVLAGLAFNLFRLPKGSMPAAAYLAARTGIAASARHNALASYANSFARLGDVMIAGALLPSDQLALYFVLTRVLDLLFAVYSIIEPLHEALWSQCLARGDRARLWHELRSFHFLSLGWTIGAGALLMLFGRHALALFGDAYLAGTDILWLLPAIALAKTLLGPGAIILTLADRERLNLWLNAVSTALYLLSVAVFGWLWDVRGAIGAMVVLVVVRGASQAWACRKALGMETSALVILPHAVAE